MSTFFKTIGGILNPGEDPATTVKDPLTTAEDPLTTSRSGSLTAEERLKLAGLAVKTLEGVGETNVGAGANPGGTDDPFDLGSFADDPPEEKTEEKTGSIELEVNPVLPGMGTPIAGSLPSVDAGAFDSTEGDTIPEHKTAVPSGVTGEDVGIVRDASSDLQFNRETIKMINRLSRGMKDKEEYDEELEAVRRLASDIRDYETIHPEQRKMTIKITRDMNIPAFPGPGEAYVNSKNLIQYGNASFLGELNEFDTSF